MYSLRLTCFDDADVAAAELWELGTAGIEEHRHAKQTVLIAFFGLDNARSELLQRFAAYSPEWQEEATVDWVAQTHAAWPSRRVGKKFFLAPLWSTDPTPAGRIRVIHNPGLACGTGEHPCTQLALIAMETYVQSTSTVIDIGTGSGLLAIAAKKLGAGSVIGIDTDPDALPVARENFVLNHVHPELVVSGPDALGTACSDITVANIDAPALLSTFDDLLRITRLSGWLILTGFTFAEMHAFEQLLHISVVLEMNEWRLLVAVPARRD